jgi:hypothetical protein
MQCGTRLQENITVFGLKLVYGIHQIKRTLKKQEHPYRSIVKMEDDTTWLKLDFMYNHITHPHKVTIQPF